MSTWDAPTGPAADSSKPLNRKERRAALQNKDWNNKGRTDPEARRNAEHEPRSATGRLENDKIPTGHTNARQL
ncbi:MAG: hypothetical protein ACI83Y_002511, partial [Candidatus Azotimanducaceae bacterium]